MRTARGPIASCSLLTLQGVVPSAFRQPLAPEVLCEAGLPQSPQGAEPAAMAGEGSQPRLLPRPLQCGAGAPVAEEKSPVLEAAGQRHRYVTRSRFGASC